MIKLGRHEFSRAILSIRRNKIDFGQIFLFILFFPSTSGNLCRRIRKSQTQVPKKTLRDCHDFRLKIMKK